MDGIFAFGFNEIDTDVFAGCGGNIFADEVRLDGKLAVAAVNEHGKLDAAGAAEIIERVHRRASGAPAEEDVVHEDDGYRPDGTVGRAPDSVTGDLPTGVNTTA